MQITKSLFGPAACMALLACAAEPEADSAAEVPAEAPAVTAADGGPSAGLYHAIDENGAVLIEELRPDGTYAFRDEDGTVIEEGTYEQKSSAELCFTAAAEGAPQMCYAEEVGDDGVWRSTDPVTGGVYVIERIE
ncbi:hypothetical protein [Aurantiacibacter gilvus]|uniref:Lipoprotein n=1 Tax=Aurantiacibacter gilvus TaxID=3139141 RepID=A0ABU9IHH1_9SPHN